MAPGANAAGDCARSENTIAAPAKMSISPVTTSRPAATADAAEELVSKSNVEVVLKVIWPTPRDSMLAPGETVPCTVTDPPMVPLPPRVAPAATLTELDAPSEPLTKSVPVLIVVFPVNELDPESVRFPVPLLVSMP